MFLCNISFLPFAILGASLKLTILNHGGRIWTMVAGGGASVTYADTISDLGFGKELANYGRLKSVHRDFLVIYYNLPEIILFLYFI